MKWAATEGFGLALGISLLALFPLSAGASPAGPEDATSPLNVKPIVGGEPTGEGEYAAVVSVLAGTGLCTGTVVAPRLVLTAAHCLTELRKNSAIAVHFGTEIKSDMQVAGVSYGSHPQFCPTCREDIYDYGYVILAQDFRVPGGFPVPITTQSDWDATMVAGHDITLVGFGEDPDAGGAAGGIGIQREVTTTITRMSKGGLEFYAGGAHQDSCAGDSGGPAFVRQGDGTLALAGITSRGSNPCGSGGYYGTPYPGLCWVRDQTGVDLVGSECGDCDCLDIASTGEDKGCAIARPQTPAAMMWLALGLAALGRRRRAP